MFSGLPLFTTLLRGLRMSSQNSRFTFANIRSFASGLDWSREILIGNIDPCISIEEIRTLASNFGIVERYFFTRSSAFSKPFSKDTKIACIGFDSPEAATQAMKELHDTKLGSTNIQVRSKQTPESCKLYVTNIPDHTDWRQLKDFFRQAGDVIHVKVFELESEPTLCAYVEFLAEEAAQKALELDQSIFGGNRIKVRKCKDTNQSKSKNSMQSFNHKKTVLITNLPYNTHEQQLEKHFSPYGIIEKIVQARPGLAIIEFASPDSALEVIQKLNYSDFSGRSINIRQFFEK